MSSYNENNRISEGDGSLGPMPQNDNIGEIHPGESSSAANANNSNSHLLHNGISGSSTSALGPDFDLGGGNDSVKQTSTSQDQFEDQWSVEVDEEEEDSDAELVPLAIRHGVEGNESEAENDHYEENEEEDELGPGYWTEELDDEDDNPHLAQQPRGANLLRNLMQQGTIELSDSSLLDVMQRIVGGMGDTSFGRQNSEYDHLIENLNRVEEPYLVLETLNELLERLLMMNGYTAERLIPAGRLAKAIVHILNDPLLAEELELHLVACRCLYNFIEVNQDFIHHALSNDVVKALIERVSEITYIDLTEQALQTLEIISRDPRAHLLIVECNGLEACLRNLDFLTIHAQRKCLIIFANACTNISRSRFPLVESAFPLLSQVVENYRDGLVIENAWLAMSRIITSYKLKPSYTEKLFENKALLNQMIDIICKSCNPSSTENGLNYRSNISLLKSLNIISAGSIKISEILLDLNIGSQICFSLNKYKKEEERSEGSLRADESGQKVPFEKIAPIEAIIAVPKELLYQLLQLVKSILPIPLDNGSQTIVGNAVNHEDSDIERGDFFVNSEPSKFWKFVNTVWPVLIHSFQGSVDIDVRREVLLCVFSITSFVYESCQNHIEDFNLISRVLVPVSSSSRKNLTTSSVEQFLRSNVSLAELKQTQLIFCVFQIVEKLIHDLEPEYFFSLKRDGLFDDIFVITDNIMSALNSILKTEPAIDGVNEKFDSAKLASFFRKVDTHEVLRNDSALPLKFAFKKMAVDGDFFRLVHDAVYVDESTTQAVNNTLLSGIIASLSKSLSVLTDSEWDNIWLSFKTLLDLEEGGISNFELMSLGIVTLLESLLKSHRTNRFFASPFSSQCEASFVRTLYSNNESISRLIQILQDSLSRKESFEVYTSGNNAIGNSLNSAASMAKQVKIKLVPAQSANGTSPSEMDSMNISVHAIATFKSMGTFLQQRLKSKRLNELTLGLQETNESDEEMSEGANDNSLTFDFFLNKEAIPLETTIFGAIFKGIQTEKNIGKVDPNDIWSKQHLIFYKTSDVGAKPPKAENFFKDNESGFCDSETGSLFLLLNVLFDLNEEVKQLHPEYCAILTEKFRNWNLTVKLNKQLEELLIVASGTLPNWCVRVAKDFPFILPLETKILFLQSTSFGYSRLIHNWQLRSVRESPDELPRYSYNGTNTISRQIGRPSRIKARISRDHFFPSAMKVLQVYGKSPDVLEIEYYDEAGSGLGPTLEFYSTISKEFCRRSLHLWRDDLYDSTSSSDTDVYVFSNSGLFPRPLDPKQIDTANGQKILYLFSQLGKFIARALLDSRMVDFDFNCVFLEMIRNLELFDGDLEEKIGDDFKQISVLKLIDPKLSKSLEQLREFLNSNDGQNEVDVEGLSLTFVLPGYPSYELIPGGSDITVTADNMDLYISKVVESFVFGGVYHQLQAFVKGFSQVFPVSSLSIFTSNDLGEIFGSSKEDWSREALADAIKPNHGYNQDSVTIERLINVLIGFSANDRRKFLKFLTGSPRLPIGGFKSMRPEFTVVRKYAEDNLISDDYLPSVMTCANYLKLPDYSLETVMYRKLIDAITEGADAFHLS